MEERISELFDYQRFEQNEALQKLIDETEARYSRMLEKRGKRNGFSVTGEKKEKNGFRLLSNSEFELLDDELTMVNAAGTPAERHIKEFNPLSDTDNMQGN